MLSGTLLGFSFGAFMSTNWALTTDLVTKGKEARYLGLTNLATAGGSALTLFIIELMIDFFNAYSSGLGYQTMFLGFFYLSCHRFTVSPENQGAGSTKVNDSSPASFPHPIFNSKHYC